jgi:hypothetical protein
LSFLVQVKVSGHEVDERIENNLSAVSKFFQLRIEFVSVKNLGTSIGRFKNLVIKRYLASIILPEDLS